MARTPAGGLVVARPAPIVCAPRSRQGIRLMSDLHIGSSQTDEALIEAELRAAGKAGDRVLLGGDVFDLILPSDRRRYSPGSVHASMRGRDDLVNAAVERAFDLLEAYADRIDAIGLGNHETAAIKSGSVDAVRLLCEKIQAQRGGTVPIIQMGYTAMLDYRLVPEAGARPAGRYVVWYHHGAGKVSTAHGAIKALTDRIGRFEADLYWSGHSHAKAACSETAYRMLRGKPVARDVRCVVTGGYLIPYGLQGAGSSRRRGPRRNYASEAGLLPHGTGGARVVLSFDKPGHPTKVEVIQ